MKYSYRWLKELTGTKKTAQEIINLINLRGFEFEEKEDLAKRFAGFVVGKVLKVEKHPHADRLKVTKVDVGSKEGGILSIVCGAPNVATGQKVSVALVGAILPTNGVKIERVKIRGIESRGMICAEDELGLGKDHQGILVLDKKLKVGRSLASALNLADTILEFDILPNRAHDCMSYEGLAREICAMEGRALKINDKKLKDKKSGDLIIKIKDKKHCPRYMGAILENITVQPSPKWMQARLIASGMEPINNVVDITNYVMLEVGSPLHAFDKKIIENKTDGKVTIVVRQAQKKEKLELLDGTKLELNEHDLIIANEEKALALAGIKGGKDSGIEDKTDTIVLEAANFNKFNLRKSRQRHGLMTEAQARFEKGIAPELAERALKRAIELLTQYAGAELKAVRDENYYPTAKQTEKLKLNQLDNLLGYVVNKKRAINTLKNLGFQIKNQNQETVTLTVPYWRLDIEGPEDFIEEVGRIEGYEKIEEKEIKQTVKIPRRNDLREREWEVSALLRGLGFDEVKNYSFYGKREAKKCGLTEAHLELEHPLSEDLSLLRKSLLPNLLKNVAHNAKYFEQVSIFELGKIYQLNKEEKQEKTMLAGAIYATGNKEKEFYNLKAKLKALLEYSVGKEISFKVSDKNEDQIFYPGREAIIQMAETKKILGKMGEVIPATAKFFGIKKPVAVFEIDFNLLNQCFKQNKEFKPLRKYPVILRDISIFVSLGKEAEEVIKTIKKSGGGDLIKVDLFDVFDNQAEEKRSLAFHLTFAKDNRTMKSKEVDKLMKKIGEALEKMGAKVREK